MQQSHIRNFSIIAHIDHGKSTLADRLLDSCKAIADREKKQQYLDTMDIERERGITIKAQSVQLFYKAKDGKQYELNLIDTPGHVDFQYEVSRSLCACEGALLVVDATQGVEAQTVSNVYLAIDQDLELVPVLNKIDLGSADAERVRADIEEVIGIDATDALEISAKTGIGIEELLEAIVDRIPPPPNTAKEPLKALVFDSWYDSFRGVIMLCRVRSGSIKKGDSITLMATGSSYEVQELAVSTPHYQEVKELGCGQVGVVIAGIKTLLEASVGDTITATDNPAKEPLPGFKAVVPVVFAGLFPSDSKDYSALKEALSKLELNDASLKYEPETSEALGFGYRCGFLGLLHMEIIQERLEREYELDLIVTAPSVEYHCYLKDGEVKHIENPAHFPERGKIDRVEEPFVEATIHTPTTYTGAVLGLCEQRRGNQIDISYPSKERVVIRYRLPLAEIVSDFYDKLKTCSRGYASLDYGEQSFAASDLVKVDVLVNGDPLDALSIISHRDTAFYRGKELCSKLKELIPRQMFEVAIQAALGSKVIARSTVKALRKNVTAKCYGGDISRKRKLLEKQKAGKKRMKQVGSVEIPQDAFLAVLKTEVTQDRERSNRRRSTRQVIVIK